MVSGRKSESLLSFLMITAYFVGHIAIAQEGGWVGHRMTLGRLTSGWPMTLGRLAMTRR